MNSKGFLQLCRSSTSGIVQADAGIIFFLWLVDVWQQPLGPWVNYVPLMGMCNWSKKETHLKKKGEGGEEERSGKRLKKSGYTGSLLLDQSHVWQYIRLLAKYGRLVIKSRVSLIMYGHVLYTPKNKSPMKKGVTHIPSAYLCWMFRVKDHMNIKDPIKIIKNKGHQGYFA